MTYDIYAVENNAFIPDVEVKIVDEYDEGKKSIWFFWRGKQQWLELSKDNSYNDGNWLITDTEYTPDFQEWLDENLENYDSLESLFGSVSNNPSNKQVYFVVAVEFDENGSPFTAFLDDERAKAVFGGADVWNTKTEEWESVDDDNNGIYHLGCQFVNDLIK
jgi:hypothetical protein